jgi:hypothetical protein
MLIDFEGFDNWNGAVNDLNADHLYGLKWLGTFANVQPGTLGGKKVRGFNGSAFYYSLASSSGVISSGQLVVGFRFFSGNISNFPNDFFSFLDSAFGVQCGLSINASNHLIFWRGSSSTVLGTGTASILIGNDYYISIKCGFSNSANVEVRVNGVTDITLTGVDTTNTANQNCGYIGFLSPSGFNGWDVDDVYILDTTASAPYNNFLSEPIRVETLFPTSNDSVTWTPNASTNVSRVNETTIDKDTTYNSSANPSDIDTFNHGSLSSTPANLYAVKLDVYARKEDVSNKTARTKLKSGGTTTNGATFTLSTSYIAQAYVNADIYLVDPNTSAAWTAANVNATKIGYELVT